MESLPDILTQKGAASLAGKKKTGSFVLRLIGVLVSVILLALLAAALILAKPQDDKPDAPAATPSSEAHPAVTVEDELDLVSLVNTFPAPLMSFQGGSGMVFVSATSADAAVPGGFGRVVTFYWQTAEGEPVTLQSIWPADALSLLEGDFHFMPYAGPTLFGSTSVRMENDQAIRIHVTTDQALYTVLLPRSLSTQVSSVCRMLQLYTLNTQD